MTWTVVVMAAAAVVAAPVIVLRRRFVAVTVTGNSMEPSLSPGARVLVRRVPAQQVQRGQIVVLRFPSGAPPDVGNPPWLIKRVAAVPGDPVPASVPENDTLVPSGRLVLLGDNTASSYDSRRAGYFTADTLLGVVVRSMRG
jgi:signal peptidase I